MTFLLAALISSPTAPRQETPVNARWEKRLEDKSLTAKQRAAYEQIAKLHTVKLFSRDSRGSLWMPSFDPKSKLPTDVLHRMGVDALPFLAEALDDETPTETVIVTRWETKVWKVNELAARLVWLIADRDFVLGEQDKEVSVREIALHPKLAPEFRKLVTDWHEKFASNTPTERKLADLADPLFRNRFDAVIWLGENKAKEGRAPIAALIDGYYGDPNRSLDSTSRAEMSYCALALGLIGDERSLPQVRRVCAAMSEEIHMAYRPQGRSGVGSSMNEHLFRSYRALTLLGKHTEAVKELNRLFATYGSEMDETRRKEFEKMLEQAKGLYARSRRLPRRLGASKNPLRVPGATHIAPRPAAGYPPPVFTRPAASPFRGRLWDARS